MQINLKMTLVASLLAVLCGCASAPKPPPPPKDVALHLTAAADLNPDAGGRPSPLVVRVYLLRQDTAFKAAEFFALYDHGKETLGADLVATQELEFKPGESRVVTFKGDAQVHTVAVMAAYRDLRNAVWRASLDLPAPAKRAKASAPVILDAGLARAGVTLVPGH
ncbi:MAG TPA: type VI secretion system lipoprotein TssJ [Steroidobacteraceae bacterium]|nr:type VI secretion system lipoprotein TssJ [Steroidobacteraceae bacterium]